MDTSIIELHLFSPYTGFTVSYMQGTKKYDFLEISSLASLVMCTGEKITYQRNTYRNDVFAGLNG